MDLDRPQIIAICAAGLAFLCYVLLRYNARKLDHIPTIGPSGAFTSYLGARRFFFDSRGMVREGYATYPNGVFKVATMDKWMVFCSGQRYAEEISKAGDDQLSTWEALRQVAAMEHTLGIENVRDPFPIAVIRNRLTRHLHACYPNIHDEIVKSFDDLIALDGDDWKPVPAMPTVLRIICRVSNRLFVGLPLCRDPDFLDMSMTFTVDVMKDSHLINLTPKFMHPLVGRLVSKFPQYLKRAEKHLGPIITHRLQMEAEHGADWPNKPNDAITWILEDAKPEHRSVRRVIIRVLMTNFVAMHTSSTSFTHALYHLAANPEYIPPLREEVDAVVKEHGWTKTAIDKMHRIDGFLRESFRVSPIACTSVIRVALKDFAFSDGVRIPAGTFLCVPMYGMHNDARVYTDPASFDPNRFVDPFGGENLKNGGDRSVRLQQQQLVMPGTEFLTWGLGKHACPGRWFAATELKTMLAHLLATYDVKLKDGGPRPPDRWIGRSCIPNATAEVLFRRRPSRG